MGEIFYKSTITIFMIMLFAGLVLAANDADLIPPEVLKQMDQDIRSGKRPIIETIHQGDIFGLRENPKFGADFVKFDFDVSKLSTVQQRIIENWIRAGQNVVYLANVEVLNYGPLPGPVGCSYNNRCSRNVSDFYWVNCTLLRHAVNTDCEKIKFARSYRGGNSDFLCYFSS